jgi:Icc-related predicted phosphoesterase
MLSGPPMTPGSRSRAAQVAAAALAALAACWIPAADHATWTEPPAGLFTTGPYILLGDEGTAYVALMAPLPQPPVVEWWVPGAAPRAVKAASAGDLWVAKLTGLPVGPRLSYRVRSTRGTSETHSFRIGIPPGESFRFAVFGDTRTGHDVHRAVIEAVANERIDFFLHTGDMVERGGVREQWDRFFQIERPLLVDTPILPSIGNHDESNRFYYEHYFLHRMWANNRRYFAHDWGNLRVVAVDIGIECRDGCTQYAFAERALAEGAERGMFMVIFLHYPPYSSGKHGSMMEVQKPITDLSRRHGVELVVAGHDHNYERTEPIHGTTYIVSGSAGAPIYPVNPRSFTASVRTEPHYVLVDVERDRMVTRAVNLQGDTFDTAVIEPNPPQPDR